MRPRSIAVLTFALCLLGAGPAHATSSTVTTTGPSGAGSLNQAILDANADAGADTISFNIAGAGPHTIAMGDTALPDITQPVTINGFSQHDSSANSNPLSAASNAVMKIVITGKFGLNLKASNSTIKGLVMNTANTNSGFASAIASTGSNNVIAGNYIGTDADGLTAPDSPNGYLVGIELTGDRTAGAFTNNRIGGSSPADRNVIVGDIGEGIRLSGFYDNGSHTVIEGSTNTTIQGNYIGTFASGTAGSSLTNMTQGVRIFPGNTGTTIGGSGAGQRNLISGLANASSGVGLQFSSQSDGVVRGNLIGTQRDGVSPLGNGIEGILLSGGREWTIGGTNAGEGNVIANNGFIGIQIKGPNDLNGDGDRNRILGNSIYHNGTQGIDLSNTLNQADFDLNDSIPTPDADNGPNENQNYPVLTSASVSGGSGSVSGTLLSVPNKTYRVEFFSNTACNAASPKDYGQGQTYLGSANVSTDGTGNGSFTNVSLPAVPAGQAVFSATATDPDGNTSEFAKCRSATGAPPPPQCADGIDNDGDGKIDLADPGCSSATDDSESPDPTTTGGGGGTTGGGTTTTTTSSAPAVQPSSFNALGSTQCSRRAISLVRADVRGKSVVLSGLVGAGLAKGKVTVKGNYKVKGKKATATVTADAKGQFSAKLTRPSSKGFAAARYTATSGSAKSIALRLTQSLATSSIRQSGTNITLKGKVKKSLLGKRNPVVIKRLVCGTYRKVTSVKPAADGSYTATFSAQGIGGAALYRAESVVLARPHAHKYVIQYARAVSITLTGQTG